MRNPLTLWRKKDRPPEPPTDRGRLMALFGGAAAAAGLSKRAEAQQPSTLTNMPFASTPFSGSELLYIVQGGISRKTNVATLESQINVSDIFTAASISVLAGVNPGTMGTTAVLTQSGRFGIFEWRVGNFTTAVTNDPGQGIYIAPSVDTTGASGCWVRQYSDNVNIGWWGALGDAVFSGQVPPAPYGPATIVSGTDNGPPLANFGTWARYASLTLGQPISVEVPLPSRHGYVFNGANCVGWALGLQKLIWYGNGTYWQNSSTNASYPPWSTLAAPLQLVTSPRIIFSWLINQTTPGAYGFSVANASALLIGDGGFTVGYSYTIYSLGTTNWTSIGAPAGYAAGTTFVATGTNGGGTGIAVPVGMYPGQHILLTSLDIYYYGYPPDPQQYEYVYVTAINQYANASVSSATYSSATGLLTLTFATAPFGATIGSALNGIAIQVSGLTGTGVSPLNAVWPIYNTGSSGTVVNLQCPTGLGTLTISGGTVGSVVVVTTEQPLRYAHLPTFPDDNPPTGGYACGAGRMWSLSTGPWTLYDGANNPHTYPVLPFDIDHEWRDLNIGAPTWYATYPNYEAVWSISGLRVRTVNYVGTAPSESIVASITYDNATMLLTGEVDKIVGNMSYRGLKFRNTLGNAGSLVWQSPTDSVYMESCNVGGLLTGNVKRFTAVNCDIGGLALFGNLGFSSGQTFIDCRIESMVGNGILTDGSGLGTIDNATAVFFGTAASGIVGSNPPASLAGVITLLKSYFTAGVGVWAMVPGSSVCLAGTSSVFTGSTGNAVQGAGAVLALTEDSACFYIQTSLEFSTLPSWCPATGNIYLFRNQGAKFIRCTGCDTARQLSAASEKGLDYWEYKSYIFGGNFNTGTNFYGLYGSLTQVIITPISVGSAVGAYVYLVFYSFNSASNFASDSGGTTIKVYVGLAGQRVITQTSFTGAQSGDAITVAGGASTYLPTGRVVGGYNGVPTEIAVFGATIGPTTSPLFKVELFFDCGQIVRKVLATQYDGSGNNKLVLGITGQLS